MDEIIRTNLQTIQQRIEKACDRAGRNPEEVKLLLATKTVSVGKIQIAIDEGYHLLGENKVQEAAEKHEKLVSQPVKWHMIGHLQTNKVKHVLKFADVIQSVDRMRLARRLMNSCVFEGGEFGSFIRFFICYVDSY